MDALDEALNQSDAICRDIKCTLDEIAKQDIEIAGTLREIDQLLTKAIEVMRVA